MCWRSSSKGLTKRVTRKCLRTRSLNSSTNCKLRVHLLQTCYKSWDSVCLEWECRGWVCQVWGCQECQACRVCRACLRWVALPDPQHHHHLKSVNNYMEILKAVCVLSLLLMASAQDDVEQCMIFDCGCVNNFNVTGDEVRCGEFNSTEYYDISNSCGKAPNRQAPTLIVRSVTSTILL